ncbi:MAG: aspartyl/asparaginyl beta-hydroxylase domain-containing protein, partial [Gammaproteobacteria bacterium]
YKGGERNESHCRQCPITAAAVEKLPLVHTPGHSPEVFFSILKPGTHIPPHYGLANFKLAVHLPLIIPGDCAIRVGNETRTWTESQCLIFDDSFQHEAWNNSSKLRVVLILEVWNPQLSEEEQQAVAAVLGVIRDFDLEYGSPPP